jgi:hypothetical protein
MLFPRGFVDWHRIWIAFFMNSMSFSEKPPDALEPGYEAEGAPLTSPTFLVNSCF